MKIKLLLLSAAMALSLQSELVVAKGENNGIEEIVVTALRREMTLQETPISITALGAETLENLGADDFLDFVGSVPGLNVRDNGPGQTRPIIRGIFGPGEAQVGVYFDETPVTGAPGITNSAGRFSPEIKPVDVNRIEVLKGPQGTLYGGGSMGGTLRIIYNQPDSSDFSSKISVEASSVEKGETGFQGSAMVNIPLVEDVLALRLVGYKRDDPGFIDNVTLGLKDMNSVETTGGRAALRWTPNDSFTASATMYYQDQEVGGGFHINTSLGDDDPVTDIGAREPFLDKIKLYNITLSNDFGWANAVYSYSYFDREAEFFFFNDFSGVPFPPLLSRQPQPSDVSTHELRFSSNGENNWDYTIGLFKQERDSFAESRVTMPDANGNEPAGTSNPEDFSFYRAVGAFLEQQSVFGELSYHFSDKLVGTLGIRYFDFESGSDVVNITRITPGTGVGVPIVPQIAQSTSYSETGETIKLHLAYDLSDDALLYAQFSQGFRAGGANQNSSTIAITDPTIGGIPESFSSDSVDNLELGFHSQWMDGLVTFNGAIYQMDWEDIQVEQRSASGLFAYLDNAGGAKVKGLELELSANVTADFHITSGISLINAELTDPTPFNRNNRIDGVRSTRSGVSGDELPNVPDFTWNIALEYGWNVSNNLRGNASLSANYTAETHSDFHPTLLLPDTNNPGQLIDTDVANPSYSDEQGGYAIVDFRVGVAVENDWSATLFVENIADERGITNIFKDGTFRREPGLNFIERPRTIGLTVTKEF